MSEPHLSAVYAERIHRLQHKLSNAEILLISNPYDLLYLVGFITLTPYEREAFLLVSQSQATLLLSSFSQNNEVTNVRQVMFGYHKPLGWCIQSFVADHPAGSRVFLDQKTLSLFEFGRIRQFVQPRQYTTEDLPLVSQLRMKKDETEIQSLRKANAVTHQILEETLQSLQVGMTEQEVQDLFERKLQTRPSEPRAFPTIVAFGEHTAAPHHQPTQRALKKNEPVLIDCGATVNYYCADVTRTIWFGDQPDPEFIKIEKIIKQAYTQTIDKLTTNHQPPITLLKAQDLDRACRTFIEQQRYGDKFIHTTGHGVGLYIHESPSISSRDETELEPNMVITIEPGIYIDGKFGYRYENSILIKEDGYEELGIKTTPLRHP